MTRSTYLRKTPLGQRSAGGLNPLRRAAISASVILRVELAVGDVEVNGVAFADGGDGAADESFGGDVAGREAAGGAGEAAVGDESDGGAELGIATDGGGDVQASRACRDRPWDLRSG